MAPAPSKFRYWNLALAFGSILLAGSLARQRNILRSQERDQHLITHEHQELRTRLCLEPTAATMATEQHHSNTSHHAVEVAYTNPLDSLPEQRKHQLRTRLEARSADLPPEQQQALLDLVFNSKQPTVVHVNQVQ
jgi:hypothetical protein